MRYIIFICTFLHTGCATISQQIHDSKTSVLVNADTKSRVYIQQQPVGLTPQFFTQVDPNKDLTISVKSKKRRQKIRIKKTIHTPRILESAAFLFLYPYYPALAFGLVTSSLIVDYSTGALFQYPYLEVEFIGGKT